MLEIIIAVGLLSIIHMVLLFVVRYYVHKAEQRDLARSKLEIEQMKKDLQDDESELI